jgi:hypothetical protein
MTAWSERLLSEFDAADARAIAIAKALTVKQLNWRPTAGSWSVGQCLDHLATTNEVYGAAISRSLNGKPRGIVQEITPGWFGAWFIRKYIEPSAATTRARAPRKAAPRQELDASILDHFLATNNQVRDLVRRASHHDVNRIRFRNPFIPVIRFTVGTGLEILTRHERRHLLQAERIGESMRATRAG